MAENTDSMDTIAYNIRLSDVAGESKENLLPIEGYETMPLVTLEEAIKSITDILPKIEEKVHIAKHNFEQRTGALTLDQAAAVMLYTMGTSSDEQSFYSVLNSILRSDQPDRCDKLKPWFLYLKLFITALSYIPSYRGTVYRGVKLDLSEYYTPGKKFIWWSFSSCTKSLGILQSELFSEQQEMGTVFVIECFSGKEISQYSKYEKEDEVLLVAARQFEVVSRINPRPHLWIVQVKEIESPFPFLKTDSSISSTLERSIASDANNSASTNICSQCSKTMTNVSTSNAETNTDDLLCNAKSEKETLSDEKSMLSNLNINDNVSLEVVNSNKNVDATNIPEFVEDGSSSSLPSLLTDSAAVPETTMNNEQTNENIMNSEINLNTVAAVEPITKNIQEKVMRLQNKLITEEIAKSIAENIRQNVALEIFYFFNNGLDDEALSHIIKAIVDRSRLKVFISDNKITDVGATYIGDLLSSAPDVMSLLYLDRNRITSQGVTSIVQALLRSSNSCLQTLSFTGNSSINDECIDDILHLLTENQTLTSLYLEKCNLSEDGKTRLRTAVTKKPAFFLQL